MVNFAPGTSDIASVVKSILFIADMYGVEGLLPPPKYPVLGDVLTIVLLGVGDGRIAMAGFPNCLPPLPFAECRG